MFDKLKKAFSSAAKGIGQKEITEKVLDDTLFDLEMSLLESDVAQEAVEALSAKLKKELVGLKLEKGEDSGKVIQSKLQTSVAEVFANAGKFDLLEKIKEKKSARQGPYVIVFLGINGTGKTTTVAKVANLIRKNGLSVVVAAGDTHRAGAIEQLTQHANKLALKVIAQRYGADPSAVGRDAVEHARKNHIDAVLVDTAGRMQTSKNLMDEMAKIVRVVKPDSKLFIGDALAGNDTINQAREFFQYSNFDGAILTKIDADAKGGSAISIAHITSKPIVYVGIGQGYDDIIRFEPDKFIESLFGTTSQVTVEDLMSAPRIAPSEAIPAVIESEAGPKEPEPAQRKEEPKPASPIGNGILTAREEQISAKHEATEEPKPAAKPAPVLIESKHEKPEPATVPPRIEEKPQETAPNLQEAPKQVVVEKSMVKEAKEEKKGRFGGLFKKKSDEEKKKDDDKKRKAEEERTREEEERARAENDEIQKIEKEKEAKKKRKEDKDTDADKVIYLTDEDIEDLLK
ncbi:MAG TPA: signal recognition particle-docking protein FtsY [Nitrososphaera sp.]|jgi:fused signal recognition particle receptor|nr:signal recognition particle-docking protein FtsY [Nitrososphaera sp.]